MRLNGWLEDCVEDRNRNEQKREHGHHAEYAVEEKTLLLVESLRVLRGAVFKKSQMYIPGDKTGDKWDRQYEFHSIANQKNTKK
jgi:hypothetical protein